MCFGGSKSTAPPAPTPATTFDYQPPDTSNKQKTQAAILSSSTQPATLGSELGSGATTLSGTTSPTTPNTTQY